MNLPKPLLPSQDRSEYNWDRDHAKDIPGMIEEYNERHKYDDRFAHIFIWVCVLTGFALIAAAFAFYP